MYIYMCRYMHIYICVFLACINYARRREKRSRECGRRRARMRKKKCQAGADCSIGIGAPSTLPGEDVQRLYPRARRIRVTGTFPSPIFIFAPSPFYPLIPRAVLFPCLLPCHLIISRKLPSSSPSLFPLFVSHLPLSCLSFNRNVISVARRKRRRISAYVRFAIRTVFKGFKRRLKRIKAGFIDLFPPLRFNPVIWSVNISSLALYIQKKKTLNYLESLY